MISIALVHTVPGDYPIFISDDKSEEDDCFVYDIGNITRRMISSVRVQDYPNPNPDPNPNSSVRVQEAPTVEHVCISDLRRHEAEYE